MWLTKAEGRLAELFDATRQKEDSKLQGKLTDKKTQIVHEIKLTAGKAVVILMNSNQFDTLLRLQDANGKLLAENDDIDTANKNTNSRILFIPKEDGVYRVIATSHQQEGRGDYDLIIRQYGPTKPK
jgi:tyrosine-protein phosphatase YwqE